MFNKIFTKKTLILATVLSFLVSTLVSPFAHAAVNDQALSISLDNVNVTVADNWQQIKNAALIQLIAQKMKTCVEVEDVLEGDGIVRSKDEAQNEGQIFNSPIGSGSSTQRIGVGPWLSDHFDANIYDWDGEADGKIYCVENDGKLFNMFVYILQYRSGSSISLESFAVTKEQRIKVICSPDANGDYTQPGILQSSNVWGTPNSNACNGGDGHYTGLSKSSQLNYLKTVYENMRSAANNQYVVSWDDLGTYSGVVGYYLYSLDFGVQCGGRTFSENVNGSHKRVNKETGKVEVGNYASGSGDDTARQSFVAAQYTCSDLIREMDDHLPEYVSYINREIYNTCQAGIDSAIDLQSPSLDAIISSSTATEEQKTDAQTVKDEYTSTKRYGRYVAKPHGEDEEEEVVSAKSDGRRYDGNSQYIWTCRSHLPFIDVDIEDEVDLEDGIDTEFARDYCKETLSLGWVVCPVLEALSEGIDGISNWIDGFFE